MLIRSSVLFLLAGLAVPAAQAQQTPSPGQLAPRTLAPEIQRGPTGVGLPQMDGTEAPRGSEAIPLRVGEILVEGGDPALAAATETAIARIRGRTVAVAEVYAAAAAIEQAYAARGYFLTRVVLPPQNVRHGGTLRLRVIEGYIEGVDTTALPAQARSRVDDVLAGITGRRRLPLGEFERRLLIAGDTPGLALRSMLVPGSGTGAVRLVLTGDHRPLAAELSVDNSLQKSLGTTSATLSAAFQSLMGAGELIYATTSGAPGQGFLSADSPRRLIAAGVIIPLGPHGLTFNAEATLSDTKPRSGRDVLETESTFRRFAFRLAYPLIRSRTTSLTLRAALEITDEEQRAPLFAAVLYDDRLRPLRFGFDWSHVLMTSGTMLGFGLDYSQGLSWLGSRGRDDATINRPISRALGNDLFSKVELRARVAQALPLNFTIELSGRAQYALSGPLLNSERFTLGGIRSLSALDSGRLVGDTGWLVRAELQYAVALPRGPAGAGPMTPYLFVSRGQAVNLRPTFVEPRTVGATNAGLGIRSTLLPVALPYGPRALDLSLEAAREFTDGPGKDGWRINVAAAARF